MDRTKRPQDVNEALSSMLWTPYNRTPSISSDESDSATPINHNHLLAAQYHRYSDRPIVTPKVRPFPASVTNAVAATKPSCYVEQQSAAARYCNSILVPVNNVPPYFMKQYNTNAADNRMVHSFTDNFLPFHIENSEHIYYQEQQQQQQQQQHHHHHHHHHHHQNHHQRQQHQFEQINRFSNDFTFYDVSTGGSASSTTTSSDNSFCSTTISPAVNPNDAPTTIKLPEDNENTIDSGGGGGGGGGGGNIGNSEEQNEIPKIDSDTIEDDDDDDGNVDYDIDDNDENGDYSDTHRYQSPNENNSTLVYVQSHHSDYSPTNHYHHQHHENNTTNNNNNSNSSNSSNMNNECIESSSTSTSHINVNVNYYRTVPVKIITQNEICENNCNNNQTNSNNNNNINNNNNNNINNSDNIDTITNNCNSNLVLQKKIHITQTNLHHHRNFSQNEFDVIHSQWIPAGYHHNLSVVNHPFVLSPMVSTISVMPTLSVPVHRPPSEISSKGCCGRWFAGPPLRALIAVVALGGLACAIGGAAVGITGLSGPPASHLTAALLMIGVGVILVTVSGAAWHMTSPSMQTCFGGLGFTTSHDLNLNNIHHHNDAVLQYSEFQHRSPPPSYHASMQEYRLRLLLLERDRDRPPSMNTTTNREISPPPAYNYTTATTNTATMDGDSNFQTTEYMKNDLFPS